MSYSLNLKKYENEKKEIEDILAKDRKGVSNPEECIDFALHFALKLPSLWSSAGYTEKQRLQFLVFPKGMFYDKKKDECRTNEVNGVFSYIADVAQVLEQSKSRNSKKKFDVAPLVVPPRIELGYQVPETCVLSIVLRDHYIINSLALPQIACGDGLRNYAKKFT